MPSEEEGLQKTPFIVLIYLETSSHCVVQAALEPVILLLWAPEWRDYGCAPPQRSLYFFLVVCTYGTQCDGRFRTYMQCVMIKPKRRRFWLLITSLCLEHWTFLIFYTEFFVVFCLKQMWSPEVDL